MSGGTVLLLAWPAEEEDPNLVDGTQLSMTVIGKTTTDSTGRYAMHVYNDQDLSSDVSSEGTVNAELQAYNGDTLSSITAVSLDPSASQAGVAASDPASSDAASSADNPTGTPTGDAPSDDPSATDIPDPATSTTTSSASPTPAPSTSSCRGCVQDPKPVDGANDTSATPTAEAPQAVDLDGAQEPDSTDTTDSSNTPACCGYPAQCTAVENSHVGQEYGIVGATYASTKGITHTFTYTKGSHTKIEVGVKTPFGYSGSGSKEVGTSASVTFGTTGQAFRYHKTGFMVERWTQTCTHQSAKGPVTVKTPELRAEYWTGGAYSVAAGAPSAHKCSKYGPGASYRLDHSTALTWTNGLSFEYEGYGIDMSMETGYNSDSELQYNITSSTNKYLCGMTGYSADDPGIVEGKAASS